MVIVRSLKIMVLVLVSVGTYVQRFKPTFLQLKQ